MVALIPSKETSRILAQGSEPEDQLHVTLSYLGKEEDLAPGQAKQILRIVEKLSERLVPTEARVGGTAYLNDECTVVLVDSPELQLAHNKIVRHIGSKSTFPSYLPHVTIDYGDKILEVNDKPERIVFERVWVAIGEKDYYFDGLAGDISSLEAMSSSLGWAS